MTPESANRRAPFPEGTVPVGIALLIAGVATYAFFRVGTSALGGDEEFAPISALWFATFSLAPGFFLPLEQELGRALAHRRATGEGGRPVVVRVLMLGAILAGIVLLVIAVASPAITQHYFDGDWFMLAALAVAFIAYAPAHLARGICSGTGRFQDYAIIMGSDGVVRIVLCVLLAAIGVTSAGPYGLAVGLAPLFAVGVVGARGHLKTQPGPESTWQEVTPNLGWLLIGSVCAAALLNAGVVAANLLADDDERELVTQFAYGVLLARVPLFMFQAVQAALLPRLSRLAARNELVEFRSGLRTLTLIVVAVGVVGTTGAFTLGPFVIERFYGAELGGRTLAMLALSSACYMLALATAQAVIALRGHALVALGWAIGFVTFVFTTWVAGDQLFRRIEIALLASSIASMIAFGLALRSKLADGVVPDGASVIEAITDMPLET
ncbi:MAG: lipopolysaccharide biosynthesis protein [Ilumatobacteraceae bacterium]